jgi:hypothetical protein
LRAMTKVAGVEKVQFRSTLSRLADSAQPKEKT